MPAITGWTWLKQGTGLFRKQPAALTTLLFANILISILVSAVPLLGPLLAIVLVPSFSMAFMKACLMIEEGERVTPAVLLTGFRWPVLGQLCKIGLVYLAASILLTLLARAAIDLDLMRQVAQPVDPKNVPQVAVWELVKMFALSSLNVSVLIALSFAAPLIYWQQMGPGKAIFYSFFAVLKSARVFVVLLLAWFGLLLLFCFLIALLMGGSVLGRVLLMWLIFLFVLLLQCAMYAGYRQIFGKPVDGASRPVDLSK
ncbi:MULTISPECIES: BPSS1780 family membrane protein [unclassified Massilia]|uniref:BPSS1780 family membrane protein n=1 Tax=unclassified Massilia TaxID=2609279 RepID=UPI001E3B88E8|nr:MULTISPECIES: BPSS1780 family membrane protein [unclassified Massilia]